MNRLRVSLAGYFIDFRTSRISQSDGTGHLVESFAGRIIKGTSQNFILSVVLYIHKMRVSAGYHKAHKRRFQFRGCKEICTDMSFDMMHTDKRKICAEGDCLCFRNTDQKRAHKSRAVGYRNGIQISETYFRLF